MGNSDPAATGALPSEGALTVGHCRKDSHTGPVDAAHLKNHRVPWWLSRLGFHPFHCWCETSIPAWELPLVMGVAKKKRARDWEEKLGHLTVSVYP